jgi:hypothetical protein
MINLFARKSKMRQSSRNTNAPEFCRTSTSNTNIGSPIASLLKKLSIPEEIKPLSTRLPIHPANTSPRRGKERTIANQATLEEKY